MQFMSPCTYPDESHHTRGIHKYLNHFSVLLYCIEEGLQSIQVAKSFGSRLLPLKIGNRLLNILEARELEVIHFGGRERNLEPR